MMEGDGGSSQPLTPDETALDSHIEDEELDHGGDFRCGYSSLHALLFFATGFQFADSQANETFFSIRA
jgi:hypothetical protein